MKVRDRCPSCKNEREYDRGNDKVVCRCGYDLWPGTGENDALPDVSLDDIFKAANRKKYRISADTIEAVLRHITFTRPWWRKRERFLAPLSPYDFWEATKGPDGLFSILHFVPQWYKSYDRHHAGNPDFRGVGVWALRHRKAWRADDEQPVIQERVLRYLSEEAERFGVKAKMTVDKERWSE